MTQFERLVLRALYWTIRLQLTSFKSEEDMPIVQQLLKDIDEEFRK